MNNADDLTTWIAGIKPGRSPEELPEWGRTSFHDAATGEVFAPAAIASFDELTVVLCAQQDGQTVLAHQRHAYVPTRWLAQQYPSEADVALDIEAATLRAVARHGSAERALAGASMQAAEAL